MQFVHYAIVVGIVLKSASGVDRDDYGVVNELHRNGELSIRLAYNLFTQRPKQELADFQCWTKMTKDCDGDDLYRVNGAGEILLFSAAKFADFRMPLPDIVHVMESGI